MRRRWESLPHTAFSAPAAPTAVTETVTAFRGADFAHSPLTAEKSRAAACRNLLREVPGQVRKRMGWHTVARYAGAVRGVYRFAGERLVHAGEGLYWGETRLCSLADRFSTGQVLGDSLWLCDGETLRRIERTADGFAAAPAAESARIPTVVLSRAPTGGGTAYEEYNLLSRGFTDSFAGTAGATGYQLTADHLDADPVTAAVLSASGVWETRTEGTDFSVNRQTGVVTFVTAPGASPVTGEDNVRITAYRTREGYAERIGHCTVSTLYGVNGAPDRLFLTGNPDFPGQDWFSARQDGAMFGDLSYSVLGQGEVQITGYSVVGDRLAAHKSGAADGRSILLRRGETDSDGAAVFPIVGALQGEPAVAARSHAVLDGEPLFLTARGIYALTASDLTGERYSRCRSEYLNDLLLREAHLEDAAAAVFHGFYLLFLNHRVYLLDSLQKSYEGTVSSAGFQYEGYVLENVPAALAWVEDDTLCFGTADGRIAAFYTDKDAAASYQDDGEAIAAYWETPCFSGKLRHGRKRFRYLSVTLAPAPVTSVTISVRQGGTPQGLCTCTAAARYFTFPTADFADFTFSADRSPRNLRRPLALPAADALQVRLENRRKNEPFGLYDLSLEYTETGKMP